MPQHTLDIVFADGEVNAAAIPTFNEPQRGVRRVLYRTRSPPLSSYIVEPLAGQRWIPVASRHHDGAGIAPSSAVEDDLNGVAENSAPRRRIAQALHNVVARAFLRPRRHERRRDACGRCGIGIRV